MKRKGAEHSEMREVVSRSGRKRASPDSSTVERQPRKLEVLVRACWLFFPYPPNALFLSLEIIIIIIIIEK